MSKNRRRSPRIDRDDADSSVDLYDTTLAAYDDPTRVASNRIDPRADVDDTDNTAMAELEEFDPATFFGVTGPLSAHLPGYELRSSQMEMAKVVKQAILDHQHALIEAPTGTGKSIAYLAPAILSGKTVVVSTANKALQSQLYQKDIPFLRQVLNRSIPAVIVKGRSNFICTYKWEKELVEQRRISLYDREDDQVAHMRSWLAETTTGDIDELPIVLSADIRNRVVSFPDDCLHGDCRFYTDDCWVNAMRDAAANAQVIITNHHLLLNALELGFAGERILPPAPIYIIDEAHHLEQIATAVYETVVTDYTVEQLLSRSIFREHVGEEELDELRFTNVMAFQDVSSKGAGNAFQVDGELEPMHRLSTALASLAQRLKGANPYAAAVEQAAQNGRKPDEEVAEHNRYYELGIESLNSTANKLQRVATSKFDDSMVRYALRLFDRRHITVELHAAPIDPADLLAAYLFHPESDDGPLTRSVICTSATLATDGSFHHFKSRCGIRDAGEERALPTVFDFGRQALLYQPPLPPYNYRNADAYYDAAATEIERLLEVSRGRTLCLFTNWNGLQQVNDRLQADDASVVWPVRAQGDAPRGALLDWFKATPHSVLLATRSFWEGVDIPGDDLSLVVMDKMPFPTPGDPLHGARMRAIEEQGRSSFAEYMVPMMTLSLKQGFGRLIRRTSDRGVVAILDERLSSKGYGRRVQQDLPPARFSRSFRDVHAFFKEAFSTEAEFAVNVWAWTPDTASGDFHWRWQLVRLQDGRSELMTGRTEGPATSEQIEILATISALQNLSERVQRAGQDTRRFAVELRCSSATQSALAGAKLPADLANTWRETAELWRRLTPIELKT